MATDTAFYIDRLHGHYPYRVATKHRASNDRPPLTPPAAPCALRMAAIDGYDRMAGFPLL